MKTQTRVSLLAALVIAWSFACGLAAVAQTTTFNSNVNLQSVDPNIPFQFSYQIDGRNALRMSTPGV